MLRCICQGRTVSNKFGILVEAQANPPPLVTSRGRLGKRNRQDINAGLAQSGRVVGGELRAIGSKALPASAHRATLSMSYRRECKSQLDPALQIDQFEVA